MIDTGPLFDGAMLAALDHSDQLLLICNPEVTSLKNVRIGLETIDRLGFERERVSLVANRVGAAGGVDLADIELALDTEVAFELPDDPPFRPPSTALSRRALRREQSVRTRARLAAAVGLPGLARVERIRIPCDPASLPLRGRR